MGSAELPAGDVEEAEDEEGGEKVDEPVHFAEFAAHDLQQAVCREAEGQAVGDAEGERDGHHGEEGGDGHFGIVPGDFAHYGDHHAAHDDERGSGGRGRDGAHHGRDKKCQHEEQSGDDGGDAGASAGRHAGRAFDIADHGRSAGARAHDGGDGVGEQDAVEARDLPHFVEEVRLFAHGHQGADVVEQIDEEEDENDLQRSEAQGGGDIEFAGGGGQIAQAIGLRRPFGDAGKQTGGGGGEDADQHGGAHPPRQQGADQQESEERQRGALIGQVAQRDGSSGIGHDDARIAEADEGDEKSHAGGHGGVRHARLVKNGGVDEDDVHRRSALELFCKGPGTPPIVPLRSSRRTP